MTLRIAAAGDVHARAHRGTFRGRAGGVRAYNVSASVVGREVCHLDLALDPIAA